MAEIDDPPYEGLNIADLSETSDNPILIFTPGEGYDIAILRPTKTVERSWEVRYVGSGADTWEAALEQFRGLTIQSASWVYTGDGTPHYDFNSEVTVYNLTKPHIPRDLLYF